MRLRILLACLCVILVSVFISFFTGIEFKRDFIYFYAYLLIAGQYFLRRYIPLEIVTIFLMILCIEELTVGLFRSNALCLVQPYGLIGNPNPSSAILLMGSVWLIASRTYWAIPFLAFLPFIGSRATILTSIPILTVIGIRFPKLTILSLLGALIIGIALYISIDQVCGSDSVITHRLTRITDTINPSNIVENITEANERTRAPFSIIPQGELFAGEDMPMHNVPFRYAYTYGIASMLAWGIVMGVCLTWKIGSQSWWLVLTIFGLSWLDYYFIEPYFLLPFTWMIFIKHLDKEKTLNQEGL